MKINRASNLHTCYLQGICMKPGSSKVGGEHMKVPLSFWALSSATAV